MGPYNHLETRMSGVVPYSENNNSSSTNMNALSGGYPSITNGADSRVQPTGYPNSGPASNPYIEYGNPTPRMANSDASNGSNNSSRDLQNTNSPSGNGYVRDSPGKSGKGSGNGHGAGVSWKTGSTNNNNRDLFNSNPFNTGSGEDFAENSPNPEFNTTFAPSQQAQYAGNSASGIPVNPRAPHQQYHSDQRPEQHGTKPAPLSGTNPSTWQGQGLGNGELLKYKEKNNPGQPQGYPPQGAYLPHDYWQGQGQQLQCNCHRNGHASSGKQERKSIPTWAAAVIACWACTWCCHCCC